MLAAIHKFYRDTTLATKILLITASVGIVVWLVSDYFASVSAQNTFENYLTTTLKEKAVDYRYFFGRYISGHRQAAKIFSTQKDLLDYVQNQTWSPDDQVQIQYHDRPPVWFANNSILRTFVVPRFALLLDDQNRVREVYRSLREEMPAFLQHPSAHLLALSNNQSNLFSSDGKRYIISSQKISGSPHGEASLLLASPIDEHFLVSSQGPAVQGILVAIVDVESNRVIASSDMNILPAGSSTEELRSHYLISKQDFYEYGSSEMDFLFVALIDTEHVRPHINEIVHGERVRRAVLALLLIGSFMLIVIWIAWRIGLLTNKVRQFSCQALGSSEDTVHEYGDQLNILEERFLLLTEEVVASHKTIRQDSEEKAQLIEKTKQEKEKRKLQTQLMQAQRMESVGRLAGGIAHDFNNILTVIIGQSDLSMRQLSEDNPMREQLAVIRESGQRAAALTRQLLAFSRKQLLSMEVVHLNDLAANLLKMLKRIMGEDISLKISSSSAQDIWADPSQMEQILMNLAVNARDAMPDGGQFVIELSDQKIESSPTTEFEGLAPGKYEKLVVRDTGCGMSQEVMETIFDPFFTTKGIGQGTGLGLATVYGIVKQHEGHIFVQSELGKGTTFTILFPVYEGKTEEPQTAELLELSGGKETILVVEDDLEVGRILFQMLNPMGYTLLTAKNGEGALQLCRNHEGVLDLLITDLIMPGMNGRELADRVKELRPNIKVIFMSGYTHDVLSKHDMSNPQVVFLPKPLLRRDVLLAVRKVFDNN